MSFAEPKGYAQKGKKVISVIIPTCDRPAEFLRTAIESALTQTLRPAEVIVVDNGTCSVDPVALPRGVTLYQLPPRVGPSRARNFGAAMAKGVNIAFLDDDDLWDRDFLQECSRALEEDESECVYGSVLELRDSGLSTKFFPSADNFIIEQLVRKNRGAGGINSLMRKETFWRVGGFDERLRISEDRDLAIRLVLSGARISFCPDAKAIARPHTGSRLTDRPVARFRLLFKYRSRLDLSTHIRLGAVFFYLSARGSVGRMLRKARLKT